MRFDRLAGGGWSSVVLGLVLGLFAVGAHAAAFDAKAGQIITKDVGRIKFHTYVTAGVSDHVIETPRSLILVDVSQVKANNDELKAFITSLRKPLARIYISHDHAHHWIGLSDFPNVPVYALPEVIAFIREKGPEELARARQRMGEQAMPYTDVVVPQHAVQLGQDTIDGVSLVLSTPEAPFLKGNLYIEFPAQKAIIHHHLAYVGAHVPMPPIEPRIEVLKAYQARGYNWVMAGHGVPLEGGAYFAKAIDYYTTLARAVAETTDPAAAKARMKAAYPDYAGDSLLDRMLPGFFKKSPQSQPCSQACLAKVMADFKASALAKKAVELAKDAEVRENMEVTTVDKAAWKDVKAVKSSAVFSDAVTGNVVSRDGVEMSDGKAAYISTRLKVEAGQITEVELSSDVARANPAYVWNLPPVLTAPVPEAERMTREALDGLAHRYFQTLTDHKPVVADYDEARCNRFHSGNQITNVSRNMVEGQGARTCVTANEGNKPWGPALEQRFPVIDPEHGIVLGITLLMYANQVMYVSEVFKVEGGRITHIDNIGLVKPGLEHTTGFGTHK